MADETQKILAQTTDFLGRQNEAEKIFRHGAESSGLIVYAARRAGVSEILRRVYDRAFADENAPIPFYFALTKHDRDARRTALRFVQTFLRQVVAFRRRDAKILATVTDLREISELVAPADASWTSKIIESLRSEDAFQDEDSFVRMALGAPLRASAAGVRVFPIIDKLHRADNIAGEADFLEILKEVFERAEIPYVFAGARRFMASAGFSRKLEVLRVDAPSDTEAAEICRRAGEKYGVAVTEQTLDLIAKQFGAAPYFTDELFTAARLADGELTDYRSVQTTANEAIFAGAFGAYYNALFDELIPAREIQMKAVALLAETLQSETNKLTFEKCREQLRIPFEEIYAIVRRLHTAEIVRIAGAGIEVAADDYVLADYLVGRYRTETRNESRAAVVGDALANALKRAPQIMARAYRRAHAVNLKELLQSFDCRTMPESLFDYGLFKENLEEAALVNTDKIKLPQIVYAAHTVAFYPALAAVGDAERSCVAIGFEDADYRDETEIVWLAAQIDSKLEAAADLTEFWCDRLEMVALTCNFPSYKLWLVAPEGFAPDATEILRARGAYGSSLRQVELIAGELQARKVFGERQAADEYEIILPMGDAAELVAARAVEEIARRHDFKSSDINKIKTALVEACINAAEHSFSPDRRIHQKFRVEGDKLFVTVANRGIKIPSEKIAAASEPIEASEGRRGWGLKLMRSLMDEVTFEQTDDGTRITMVKYRTAEQPETTEK